MVCVSPSHVCRLRAPRMLKRVASVQPWICLDFSVARTSFRHFVPLAPIVLMGGVGSNERTVSLPSSSNTSFMPS